jgi:hypothetical protein
LYNILGEVYTSRCCYEYLNNRASDEIPELKTCFPGCTNVFACVQLQDRSSNGELILTTGTKFTFRGPKQRACPMLFVCGILNDDAACKDRLQFRVGTSSMALLLVNLTAVKTKTGLKGGFDDYVSKCIANENTGVQ